MVYLVSEDLLKQSPKVLGYAEALIADVGVNKSARLLRQLIGEDSLECKASITFSIAVENRDKYVRILAQTEDQQSLVFTQKLLQQVKHEMYSLNSPEPIRSAMLNSQLIREAPLVRIEMVRDLLYDAQQLTSKDAKPLCPFKNTQPRSMICSATRIFYNQYMEANQEKCIRISPMNGIAMRLNLVADGYIFCFPNRYRSRASFDMNASDSPCIIGSLCGSG